MPTNCIQRSWRLCTRLSLTTMCIWRELYSNQTWSPLDTPVPRSTPLSRLPWQQLLLSDAPCQLLYRVRQSCTGPQRMVSILSALQTFNISLLVLRHLLPLWWSKWGGGLFESERHEPASSAQALEAELLLWPCSPGLGSCCMEGTSSKQEGWHRTAFITRAKVINDVMIQAKNTACGQLSHNYSATFQNF